MDYYPDRGYEDLFHQQQEQHDLSLEYGIQTIDNYDNREFNSNNVNTAEIELNHSLDNRDLSSRKLFVGGVSWETSEETFTDHFSKYGEVVDSVIMRDKHSGRPRGFGFVTFADPTVARKVLEQVHVIDGRTVEVKETVSREEMEVKSLSRTKKIFVGGLPTSLTEDELKEYFCFYGDVIEHHIMLDHQSGRSRGFGFVTFETEDAVERIFSEGNKVHELGGKQVEIKKAEPKRFGDHHGSLSKSFRDQGGSAGRYGFGDRFNNGKANSNYGGYDEYGGHGSFMRGSYGGPFFGGYGGGYGYGYGFGGSSVYGGGYGGVGGYNNVGGYNGANVYNGGRTYGGGGGGYGSNAYMGTSRYHPYQN